VGEETVVERSSEKMPGWVTQLSTEPTEESAFFYVTGNMSHVHELSMGLDQAQANGVQRLLNTLTNRVKSSTTQALSGANMSSADVGRYSEFAVAWVSDTPRLTGVLTPESYWEKVQRVTANGVEYSYNCFVRLKLSKDDYKNTIRGACEEMLRKAQEEKNRVAEEIAKDLLNGLRK